MKRERGYEESNDERLSKVQDFIRSLKFSVSLRKLQDEHERHECPKCHKRRLFYCYDCLTVVHPELHPAPLPLPLNVYVVLHPNEIRGKSTSLAASTISPDLHIVEYPTVPEHLKPETTLVLYPSAQSVELDEVDHLETYENVVFVDSTWQQSKGIARDPRVSKFKHVRIKSQVSLFWRFQNNDPSYLATVEAIYYFLREYIAQCNRHKAVTAHTAESTAVSESVPDSSSTTVPEKTQVRSQATDAEWYHGEVDDLLLYYINQYIGVQRRYLQNQEKYTDRHFQGYILEGASWDELLSTTPSRRPPLGISTSEAKADRAE